ncbi:MAG TPA: VOC family protein, partial [Solirubrobacteraceae bacterium]|nr:VOC family protein [Solirubrobacteraceae bacterium]
MGERTQYATGTFCWADLASTDQPAAKEFYTGLFGWDAEDMPVGDGAVYSMMRVDGKRVAAIGPQGDALREAGAPSAWGSYVTVESADASTARAS